MKEINFQRMICKGVEEEGGFGRKWSSEFQAGPPDLVLSHEETNGAFFMEVKLMKEPPPKYNRKLGITPIQRDHLKGLDRSGSKVCIGLVHYYPRRFWDLIFLPWCTEKFAFDFENQRSNTLYWTRRDLVHNVKDRMYLNVVKTAKQFFEAHGYE